MGDSFAATLMKKCAKILTEAMVDHTDQRLSATLIRHAAIAEFIKLVDSSRAPPIATSQFNLVTSSSSVSFQQQFLLCLNNMDKIPTCLKHDVNGWDVIVEIVQYSDDCIEFRDQFCVVLCMVGLDKDVVKKVYNRITDIKRLN